MIHGINAYNVPSNSKHLHISIMNTEEADKSVTAMIYLYHKNLQDKKYHGNGKEIDNNNNNDNNS